MIGLSEVLLGGGIRRVEDVPKEWGSESVMHNGAYSFKVLRINAGAGTSFHRHRIKSETFLVIDGEAQVSYGADLESLTSKEISNGEFVSIPAGLLHRIRNVGPTQLLLVEAGTHHAEADTERLKP